MPWTERQHRLLQAMGVPWWGPPLADTPVPARHTTDDAAAECPAAAPEQDPGGVDRPRASGDPPAAQSRPVIEGGPPPHTAVAGMDWSALRQNVADCQSCALHQGRRQTVFGVGGERARWLIVGEAPGEQEDRHGEPFVGPSGQLLDRMLAALGLSRAADAGADPARQAYIANTLKCRPPGNRNPTAQELACCEPFLVRQIELLQPRIIVAVGRFAVQSLLRSDEPIGRLRGRVHRYQGRPLVVSYHPAYLLRNPADKAKAWADWCLAAETLEAAP